jgi:hypothetical protein
VSARPDVFYKAVAVNGRRSAAPTRRELDVINRFARQPLSAAEVYVGECDLCNDRVDRAFERFTAEVLQDFADSLPGKSLLAGHDHGSLPLGLWFDARLRRDERAVTHLRPSFYIVKTRDNEHHRAQLDGGVYRYASIGFRARDLVCDICGKSWFGWECQHYPGRGYDVAGQRVVATAHYTRSDDHPAEAVEGSIVYLGCQYDAELKAAMGQKSFGGVITPRAREALGGAGAEIAARMARPKPARAGGEARLATRIPHEAIGARGTQARAPVPHKREPGEIERAIKETHLDQLVAARLSGR